MSHLSKCKNCRIIHDFLKEKYWTINDKLLEKVAKRRCGKCRLLFDSEARALLAQQALLKDNMKVLKETKICKYTPHMEYKDGTMDKGETIRKVMEDARYDGDPNPTFLGKNLKDWFSGQAIPGVVVHKEEVKGEVKKED